MLESEPQDIENLSRVNLITGCAMVGIGLFAYLWFIPVGVTVEEHGTDLSAAFMPSLAAISMMILGAAIAVTSLKEVLGRVEANHAESEENEMLGFGRAEVLNTIVLCVASTVSMAAFLIVGFAASSTLLLVFGIYFTGFRRVWLLLIIAVAFPVSLEMLLWYALEIQLPNPFLW